MIPVHFYIWGGSDDHAILGVVGILLILFLILCIRLSRSGRQHLGAGRALPRDVGNDRKQIKS